MNRQRYLVTSNSTESDIGKLLAAHVTSEKATPISKRGRCFLIRLEKQEVEDLRKKLPQLTFELDEPLSLQ